MKGKESTCSEKMAATMNVVTEMTQNGQNNTVQPSLVVLDSDEEEEQTTRELFEGFVKASQPFLERKEVLLLRVKFAEIRSDYASCSTFRDMLRRRANQVRNTDAYIHFNEVLKDLIKNAALYGRKVTMQDNRSVAQNTSVTDGNSIMAGKFESHQHNTAQTPSAVPSTSVQSAESDEVIDLNDQSSSQKSIPSDIPIEHLKHLSEKDKEKIINKRNRKKKIHKLELRLKCISSEIKRLTQSELSLEEMDLADSNYIKESKLKRQFNATWEKICQLRGRPPKTGRVVEQKVKIKGTRFPAIDRAVQKFLKKKKGFPNIFDIRNVVIRANKKHNLKLTPSVLHEIAADVFTDIGNKLQKKRKKDYEYNFGCHLTDDCPLSLDPALNDNSLRRKLEDNKKVSQNAMENIFEKYVHLGRIKDQDLADSHSSSQSDSEGDSSGTDSHRRKKSKKSKSKKRSSPYSSDDESRKAKKVKHEENSTTTMILDDNEITASSVSTTVLSTSTVEQTQSPKRPAPSSTDHESRESHKLKLEGSTATILITLCSDVSSLLPSTSNFNHDSTLSTRPQQSVNRTKSKCIEIIIDDDDVPQSSDGKTVSKADKSVNEDPAVHVTNPQSSTSSLPSEHVETVTNSESQSGPSMKEIKESVESNVIQNDCVNEKERLKQSSNKKSSTVSSKKVNINASKLHLKIKQLRDKKLSGLMSESSHARPKNVPSDEKQTNTSDKILSTASHLIPSTNTAAASSPVYQLSSIVSTIDRSVCISSVNSTVSDTAATSSAASFSPLKQLANGHNATVDSNKSKQIYQSNFRNNSPLKKLIVSINKLPCDGNSTGQQFSNGCASPKGHHKTTAIQICDASTSSVVNRSPLRNREKRTILTSQVHSPTNHVSPIGLVRAVKQASHNKEKVTHKKLYEALSKLSSVSPTKQSSPRSASPVIILSDDED